MVLRVLVSIWAGMKARMKLGTLYEYIDSSSVSCANGVARQTRVFSRADVERCQNYKPNQD
jgi:hypothetical protein